jgi:type II secretion system protein N
MKRVWKSKILWFTVYAVFITCVFLYLLFPSELVRPKLEAAVSSREFALKTMGLQPSLPFGVKLERPSVYVPPSSPEAVFQGNWFDAQFLPWSIFQKSRQILFKGEAYTGRFSGRAGLLARGGAYSLAEGRIAFQGIDLASYGEAALPVLRGVSGSLKGNLSYDSGRIKGSRSSGKIYVYLTRGAYLLPEPFLGMTQLEFDRGEIRAEMQNGSVMVDKLEAYGQQMNCFLSGDIQLAEPVQMSRLNLKGILEIAGNSKVKTNITIGGTLSRPTLRYI